MSETENSEKKKFVFNCTKCGKCCLDRGPIPLVFEDLEIWAKNNVVSNMIPYLKFIKTPYGTLDLVLSRQEKNPFAFIEEKEPSKKDEDPSCPLFNKDKKLCTIWNYRPLSCATYPLEYDGQKYSIVDSECPGIDQGEMSKEDRIVMRETAKRMNQQLKQMRIVMPIISQAMQTFVLKEILEQQKKFAEMSPEEQAKMQREMEEEMKRNK
jgi:Fe-S-cluster containining protein